MDSIKMREKKEIDDYFCNNNQCPNGGLKFRDPFDHSIFTGSQNKGKGNELKKYAQVVIDNYRKDILRAYRKLKINPRQQRLGRDFIIRRSDFEDIDKFDTIDKTSSISIPCLIIVGKQDKLTPLKYSMYFNNKIEKSKLVVIDKAGHMVMLEKPEEVNKSIDNFIRDYLGEI